MTMSKGVVLKPFQEELRRGGFKRISNDRSKTNPDCQQYARALKAKITGGGTMTIQIVVQLWGDGKHRASHSVNGHEDTVPSEFQTVTGMLSCLDHEAKLAVAPGSTREEFRAKKGQDSMHFYGDKMDPPCEVIAEKVICGLVARIALGIYGNPAAAMEAVRRREREWEQKHGVHGPMFLGEWQIAMYRDDSRYVLETEAWVTDHEHARRQSLDAGRDR